MVLQYELDDDLRTFVAVHMTSTYFEPLQSFPVFEAVTDVHQGSSLPSSSMLLAQSVPNMFPAACCITPLVTENGRTSWHSLLWRFGPLSRLLSSLRFWLKEELSFIQLQSEMIEPRCCRARRWCVALESRALDYRRVQKTLMQSSKRYYIHVAYVNVDVDSADHRLKPWAEDPFFNVGFYCTEYYVVRT